MEKHIKFYKFLFIEFGYDSNSHIWGISFFDKFYYISNLGFEIL
jgi:hypothetical protein